MTKYRTGVANVTLSGTDGRRIGGQTWQKNGRVREHVGTITQPNTAAQAVIKNGITVYSRAWGSTLTTAQRTSWITAAASDAYKIQDPLTGYFSNPSGFELFMQINNNLAITGGVGSPTTTPPVLETPGNTYTETIVIDASAGTFVWAYLGDLNANELHVVNVSAPQSPGRMTYRESKVSKLTSMGDASPLALGTEYVAKYGAITGLAGYNVYYRIEAVNEMTGQKRLVAQGVVAIIA